MPVQIDISENKVFARAYQRGFEEGFKEGFKEGLQETARPLLRRQIEKRFGILPDWADRHFAQLSGPELSDMGVRLLEVQTLQELFG